MVLLIPIGAEYQWLSFICFSQIFRRSAKSIEIDLFNIPNSLFSETLHYYNNENGESLIKNGLKLQADK